MVCKDLKSSDIYTPAAFHNALLIYAAISGSTSAQPHILAISHYVKGMQLSIADWQIGRKVPMIVNCQPNTEE
jgi:dihydroxy-acid dehydratase